MLSRREFLISAGATALAGKLAPAAIAAPEFKIGYHAITWGSNLEQAIEDIAALGFRGIQIRRPDYEKYASRASEFKELLAQKKLTLVSISTGGVSINPATEKQEIEDRVQMARFMREVGGLYLQATDSARNKAGNKPEDYKLLGRRLTEIGKRTLEFGIKLGYHNHMNDLGEKREEVDWILDATDPRYVWVLADIAHMQAAGGDPVKFVDDYANRLVYPHFKDVVIQPQTDNRRPSYEFVELGRGQVNIPAVLGVMKRHNYRGWIIIELDRAQGGRTPKECALISKRYVEEKLKLKV
jgi:inosose dehydratase